MKKTLIAAAIVSLSGAAFAQTNIVLGGNLDIGVAIGSGNQADSTALTGNRTSSSNIHIRGVEDMAGGLKAAFWLESSVGSDTGLGSGSNNNNQAAPAADPVINARNQGLTFDRRATTSLAGSWGEIRLGRDYTPHFWTLTGHDPFGTNGVGASRAQASRTAATSGQTNVRASNSIAYGYGYALNGNMITGTGGIYFTGMYYLGENASDVGATKDDGTGSSFRLGYAGKNWTVAVASGSTNLSTGDVKVTNVGGNYNLGPANLMAYVNTDKVGTAETKGYLVGVSAPMGQGLVRATYSAWEQDVANGQGVDQIAVGYVHNLSKRTSLIATYARVSNENGATAALNGSKVLAGSNGSSSGIDLGIRHQF